MLTLVPLLKLLLVEMGGALQLGELFLGELRLTAQMSVWLPSIIFNLAQDCRSSCGERGLA